MRNDEGALCRQGAMLRISAAEMASLRVRMKGSGDPPPDYLYQGMPMDAATLIHTIPEGTSAVSIPQQNGLYAISREMPDPGSGFVIAYARRADGRYEAEEVLCGAESFTLSRFRDFAARWIDTHLGGMQPAPDSYAYFAPDRERWGVILRDGGFAVSDPSSMPPRPTRQLLQRRSDTSASGVLARLPLQTGRFAGKQHCPAVFARVELAEGEDPSLQSTWIPFVAWQRSRAVRSVPPEQIVPRFRRWLRALAEESRFESWNFRKGMFFGDHVEWWGDRNRRRTSHEGIDFAEGLLPGGAIQNIPEETPVHAMAAGELAAVLDDFLNKTVIVRHPGIKDDRNCVFHTIFSHIRPEAIPSGPIVEGQLLGRVAGSKKSGAPPHLHLTGAWIPEEMHPGGITIDMINSAFAPFVLINFNGLLSVEHSG